MLMDEIEKLKKEVEENYKKLYEVGLFLLELNEKLEKDEMPKL